MRPGQALDSYGNVTLPHELPSRLREEELEKAKAVTISQDRLHSVALYPQNTFQKLSFSSGVRLENQQLQDEKNNEVSNESSSQVSIVLIRFGKSRMIDGFLIFRM